MAIIIDRILHPYGFQTNISPKLSLFLDFNVLISWYISTLVSEMRLRVDNVMNVWKDRERDVTGETSFYTSKIIPWIPQRILSVSMNGMILLNSPLEEGSTTNNNHHQNHKEKFCTNIPEDIMAILNTYLSYGKIIINNKDIIAIEFHISIEELNKRIIISYFHAFLYLGNNYYLKELLSLNFLQLLKENNENELTELIIWICSVINDCYRLIHYPFQDILLSQINNNNNPNNTNNQSTKGTRTTENDQQLPKEIQAIIQETINLYQKIFTIGIEYISSYIFHLIFMDDHLLYQDNFFYIWFHSAVNTMMIQDNNNNNGRSNTPSSPNDNGLLAPLMNPTESQKTTSELLSPLSPAPPAAPIIPTSTKIGTISIPASTPNTNHNNNNNANNLNPSTKFPRTTNPNPTGSSNTTNNTNSNNSNPNQMEVMKELVDDLLKLLDEIINYLEIDGMYALLQSIIQKLLIIFIYLLRDCRNHKINFTMNMLIFTKFKNDYHFMKQSLLDYGKKLISFHLKEIGTIQMDYFYHKNTKI